MGSNSNELTARAWLDAFLAHRGVDAPDGRSLHAYRCSAREFEELKQVLTGRDGLVRIDSPVIRAFALYASEWWRRSYTGGPWEWEPLLNSIAWTVPYHELYEALRSAWRWWQVKPVVLGAQIRYLGTFASQGGLPLALVQEHSGVRGFLRALLKEYERFRRVVDDGLELAASCATFLPRSLRNESVFQLGSELMDQVWSVRDVVRQANDPIKALDEKLPNWRIRFPVDIDDAHARRLIDSLLRDAGKVESDAAESFVVRRALLQRGDRLELVADTVLPRNLPKNAFAKRLGVPADILPARFELRAETSRARPVGIGRLTNDEVVFTPASLERRRLEGLEATSEIRLVVSIGHRVGTDITPVGGLALDALPWVFADRAGHGERYDFVGQGSIKTRYPEVLVLLPTGSAPQPFGEGFVLTPQEQIVGRVALRLRGTLSVDIDGGVCVIRTAQEKEGAESYLLSGARDFSIGSSVPVFRGPPKVYAVDEDKPPRGIPADQVQWRSAGGKWSAQPTVPGLWQLRVVDRGELRLSTRVGILPSNFSLELLPGRSHAEGCIRLRNAGDIQFGCSSPNVNQSQRRIDSIVDLELQNVGAELIDRVEVAFHWNSSDAIVGIVPFPGRGARFVGGRVRAGGASRAYGLDDLYGGRLLAVSPSSGAKYTLVGELKANDVTSDLLRALHFSVKLPLVREGLYELPLVEIRDRAIALLSATRNLHSHVRLTIEGPGGTEASAIVEPFSANFVVDHRLIWIEGRDSDSSQVIVEARKFSDPARDPVFLTPANSEGVRRGWTIAEEQNDGHAWLLTARIGQEYFVRPTVFSASSREALTESDSIRRLADAADCAAEDRDKVMRIILDRLQSDPDDEENRQYIYDVLDASQGLPAKTFHLLDLLVEYPRLLIQLLLRANKQIRSRIWSMEREMPFCWHLVPIELWREEVVELTKSIRSELGADADTVLESHLLAVFEDAIALWPSLRIARETALHELGRAPKSSLIALARNQSSWQALLQALTKEHQKLLQAWADREDWPSGPTRSDWERVISASDVTEWRGLWRNTEGVGFQMPITDAPFGAALLSGLNKGGSSFLVQTTKYLRDQDPNWFNAAYTVVLALVLAAQHKETK